MKQSSHKILIGSFLIIGTLLALYIIIEVAHSLYWGQLTTLMHRLGAMQKIGLIVLYIDVILFSLQDSPALYHSLERNISGNLLLKGLS